MSPEHPRATVLIVDNDEDVVRLLERHLQRAAVACVTASCITEAVSIYREAPVDLIVTDLNMPDGNGISLLRQIRTTSDVPMIVVSGFRDAYRCELRSLPDVRVFGKPFDLNELLDAIETGLMVRRAVG